MSQSRLEFTLELVTPAFVAGGSSREANTNLRHQGEIPQHRLIGMDGDGLRIPSLRGLLRFWFRAKEGPEQLARREASVFGSTDRGQGVRLIPTGQSAWQSRKETADAGSAKAYLGYGPLNYVPEQREVSSHNKFAFRDSIPEGTSFSFLAVGTPEQIEELRKCLTLLHLFGGIGGRSRRGWGSLKVVSKDMPDLTPAGSVGPWIQQCLSRHVWSDPASRPSARTGAPAYSAFWGQTRVLCLESDPRRSEPLRKASEVFEAFYQQFRATRLYNRNRPEQSPRIARDDHDEEWATVQGSTLTNVPLRLAFGFPYNVSFRDRSGLEYTASATSADGTVEINRRASPMLLKVLKLETNRFCGVALFFNDPLFRPGARIGAKGKKAGDRTASSRSGTLPPPAYTAVEAFLNQPGWTTVPLP